MARRSLTEQAEHDRVVRLAAKQRFPQGACCVFTNPGAERNRGLDYRMLSGRRRTVYPDIVALWEADANVLAVGEVETVGTVKPSALPQWRLFARHAPDFYLFVPLETADTAEQLAAGIGNLHLRFYCFDDEGRIVVGDG